LTALPNPLEGVCIKVGEPGNPARSCEVRVTTGLGPTRFGWVWAHEHTHAMLWLADTAALSAELEEGVCQLVAMVWLTNCGQPVPQGMLRALWNDPHPVYGQQMRECVRAARRHGVPAVLREITTRGQLPPH
jgi:hypothetical protein